METEKLVGLNLIDGNAINQFYDKENDKYLYPIIINDSKFRPDILNVFQSSKNNNKDSALLRLGFIDSGLLIEHPIFKGRIHAYKDFTGEGIIDKNGHGTQVAYIHYQDYLKYQNSLNIEFVIAKVLNKNLEGKEKNLIEAINWIKNQDVLIVNMSLGINKSILGINLCRGTCKLCKAAKSLATVIPLVTVAAGNDGVTTCPARSGVYDNTSRVIAVGARKNDSKEPEDWSGKANIYSKSNHLVKIYDKEDVKLNKSKILIDIASAHYSKQQFNDAERYFNLSLEEAIKEKKGQKYLKDIQYMLFQSSLGIADKYFNLGKFDDCIKKCVPNINALIAFKEKRFSNLLFGSFVCLGISQAEKKEFGNSLINFEQALSIYKSKELKVNDERLGYLYSYRGLCHLEIGGNYFGLDDFKLAEIEFEKYSNELSFQITTVYLNLSACNWRLGNPKVADKYLNKAKKNIDSEGYDSLKNHFLKLNKIFKGG